jgi:hypothetical protein
MADTGACVDAVSREVLSQHKLDSAKPIGEATVYNTAGGPVTVDSSVPLYSRTLQTKIKAHVLEDTPSILSMGRRCIDEQYGFYWPPGKWPYIVRPDGKRIDCVVQDYIPYVMEEGRGTACPLTEGGSSSSSSRPPRRDEGTSQPERGNPEEPEGGIDLTPGHAENNNNDDGDVPKTEALKKDDMTLTELEAQTLHHLLTHTPKNPSCKACQRAKMQRKPHSRKSVPIAERTEAVKFSDLITGDHIVTASKMNHSIDGQRDAVVLYDVATMYMDCYPTGSRHADETLAALQHFIGPRETVELFYTDAARELHSAAKT